jgi:CHAD domain-containing protein
MSCQERLFSIEREPESLILQVAKSFKVAANRIQQRRLVYLDSFDWALFSKGLALTWESSNLGSALALSRLDGETISAAIRSRAPAFCADLDPCPMRKRIENAVGVRRLLPRLSLNYSGWEVRILDEREKVIVVLLMPEGSVRATFRQKKARSLPRWVRVLPVRGFESAHKELADLIGRLPDAVAAQEPFFSAALHAAGEAPLDYSSRLNIHLARDTRAGDAIQMLLAQLFRTMMINERGVLKDLDPEFLHDFRVAVRRTRALLGRFSELLNPHVLEAFSSEFRWLGQATGKKRDLDVFLIKLEELKARRIVDEIEDLEPLIRLLRNRQKEDGLKLAEVMSSPRFRELFSAWDNALNSGSSFQSDRADELVFDLASPRIWKVYRRILKKGTRLSASAEPPLLHSLRIECKKLRYLLEFFKSLYSAPLMSGLISDLKGLQDILGDFNDSHVQYRNLKTYVEEAWAEQEIPAQTFLVAGRLLEQMEASQNKLRQHFTEKISLFANRSRKKALKRELTGRQRGAR